MRISSIVSRNAGWSSAFALLVAAASVVPLAACSDSSDGSDAGSADSGSTVDVGGGDAGGDTGDASECPTTGTGSVTVTVSGLPVGVDAKVEVAGAPAPVTATATLSLAGGAHAVTASVVTTTDPVVRTVFKPTVSTASVCVKGDTTATVTVAYERIASSHALWITHGNGTGEVASLPGDGLGATGTIAAAGFNVGVPSAASSAFDRDGNLWISSGGGEVRRFRAVDLGAAGTKTPDVTLTSAEFSAGIPGPGPLAFDKAGDLWVGLVAQKKLVKIPGAAAAAGAATPTVVLEHAALEGMGAIAFDKSGNLFVGASDRVLRYDVASLAASSTAAPQLSLEAKTPSPIIGTLATPSGLAFDATGNLWVSYFASNVISRLTPAEIGASGTTSITPAVQLKIAVTVNLEEIAFDESGGLWLTYSPGKVARLAPVQLASSADVTPTTVITGTGLGDTKGLAFFPAPAALPLYSALP